MCGILGVFGKNPTNNDNFESMLSTLTHRGPDDSGVVQENNFVLGHQRLAIMDVIGAHQPFATPGNKVYAICNGEIYNYRELRDRLTPDYPFRTQGDSEVLLPLYQQLGSGLTEHLDGMFSFVVSEAEKMIAARDPVGIKPLYYAKSGDSIFFASEIKAIAQQAEEIREFPNGHYYKSGEGFFPYYQPPRICIY